MSWKDIKEEIYSIVDGMTVAGGYNYNWVTIRRIDAFTLNDESCVFSLRYPTASPFRENITRDGDYPADSMTEIYARDVELVCKPVSDMLEVDVDDVLDLNNDAIDKAQNDIDKAINIGTLNTCGYGILGVEYGASTLEVNTSGDVYYPYLLNITVRIIYSKSRSI